MRSPMCGGKSPKRNLHGSSWRHSTCRSCVTARPRKPISIRPRSSSRRLQRHSRCYATQRLRSCRLRDSALVLLRISSWPSIYHGTGPTASPQRTLSSETRSAPRTQPRHRHWSPSCQVLLVLVKLGRKALLWTLGLREKARTRVARTPEVATLQRTTRRRCGVRRSLGRMVTAAQESPKRPTSRCSRPTPAWKLRPPLDRPCRSNNSLDRRKAVLPVMRVVGVVFRHGGVPARETRLPYQPRSQRARPYAYTLPRSPALHQKGLCSCPPCPLYQTAPPPRASAPVRLVGTTSRCRRKFRIGKTSDCADTASRQTLSN
mmetsp:Transcript_2988/g.8576  ORF Transcript_2988/g.8576 Transcript_2988/m.8576 type:complete len:318 (+) Transcript_2988:451-1404(+)